MHHRYTEPLSFKPTITTNCTHTNTHTTQHTHTYPHKLPPDLISNRQRILSCSFLYLCSFTLCCFSGLSGLCTSDDESSEGEQDKTAAVIPHAIYMVAFMILISSTSSPALKAFPLASVFSKKSIPIIINY